MITVYYYDKQTGRYIGSGKIEPTKKGQYNIPEYATVVAPPIQNSDSKFEGGEWLVSPKSKSSSISNIDINIPKTYNLLEQSSKKEVHEIVESEFLLMQEWNQIVYLQKNPNNLEWSKRLPPTGTWRWDRYKLQDGKISRLEEVSLDDLEILPIRPIEDPRINYKIKWLKGYTNIEMPLEGYKGSDGALYIDDYIRYKAIFALGVRKVLTWITYVKDDISLNRKRSIDLAIEKGLKIPPEVLYEYNQGFGYDRSISCPVFDSETKRKILMPPIYDQLEALYLSRHGDDSKLREIDNEITQIRRKYPT